MPLSYDDWQSQNSGGNSTSSDSSAGVLSYDDWQASQNSSVAPQKQSNWWDGITGAIGEAANAVGNLFHPAQNNYVNVDQSVPDNTKLFPTSSPDQGESASQNQAPSENFSASTGGGAEDRSNDPNYNDQLKKYLTMPSIFTNPDYLFQKGSYGTSGALVTDEVNNAFLAKTVDPATTIIRATQNLLETTPLVKDVFNQAVSDVASWTSDSPLLQGVVKGYFSQMQLGSSDISAALTAPIINQQPKDTGEAAQQTVGEILGGLIGFTEAAFITKGANIPELVGAKGVTELPLIFAVAGQMSDSASTTVQQRLEQIPVDVAAGFILHYIPGAPQLLSKERLVQSLATGAVLSGQSFVNNLIQGMKPEDAAKAITQTAIVGMLLGAVGKGNDVMSKEIAKTTGGDTSSTYTPTQLRQVASTISNESAASNHLNLLADRAEADGKNVSIDINKVRVDLFKSGDAASALVDNAKLVDPESSTTPDDVVTKANESINENLGSQAYQYQSAQDFADAAFGAKPTDQIGFVKPTDITPRDPVDKAQVATVVQQIKDGVSIDPIRVTNENGSLITTDGTQRAVAYQEAGVPAPVIVNTSPTSAPVAGLGTIEQLFNDATKSGKPVTGQAEGGQPVNALSDTGGKGTVPAPAKVTETGVEKPIKEKTRSSTAVALSKEINTSAETTHAWLKKHDYNVDELKIVPINDIAHAVLNDEKIASIEKVRQEKTTSKASPVSSEPKVAESSKPVESVKPAPLTPVGKGETKTSGLAKGVEAKAIENKLTESLGGLPEYKTVSMKDQAAKASELLAKDEERAIRIATGVEDAPEGLLPESVFVAVENKATKDGNVELLRQLANSTRVGEATAMGQRIRTLAERDPYSAVGAIKQVQDARTKLAEKKLDGKTVSSAVKEITKNIKSEVKAPDKTAWESFLNDLECK